MYTEKNKKEKEIYRIRKKKKKNIRIIIWIWIGKSVNDEIRTKENNEKMKRDCVKEICIFKKR